MDQNELLAALLDFADVAPSPLGWHAAPIESQGLLLLADSRAEATMMILETVAGEHGGVVASGSKPGTGLIGCLIDPNESDVMKAADQLRGGYAIATTASGGPDDTGRL